MPIKTSIVRTSLGMLCAIFIACGKPPLYREYVAIPEKSWSNKFNPKFDVPITSDGTSSYRIGLTIRHTPNYKYSNLFLLLKETYPGGQTLTYSIEIPMTSSDGRWRGKGSGNILSCQSVIFKDHKYPEEGTFSYEIIQNMKENPLPEITDIGFEVQPNQ